MDTVKLSNYLEDSTVGFVGSMSKLFVEDGIPLLRGQNILPFALELTDPKFISSETHAKWKKSALNAGDVVLVRVGHPGTCCVIPEGMGALNAASLVILRTVKEKLDPYFLSIFFNSSEGKRQVDSLTVGSVQSVFNVKTANAIEIPDFALPEQRRIVDLIKGLNDKIELNQKTNKTLEEIAKAIFKSWFVDFDPVRAKAEGRSTGLPPEISDLFPDELVDSEIGEIPKGWATSSLLSLCKKIDSGGTPSRKTSEYWDAGTISWFKTGEFCDSPLLKSEEHITPQGLEKSAAKEWSPETILFAMYGATVGKMAYLTETGTANQAVAGINPDEKFGFAFVWQTLISGRSRLMSLANGAAQQNLNLGLVKDFTVTMPSAELARTFSDVTNPIYHRITLLHKESDCLSSLRDTLLPKLISGELRIPDAEKFLEEAGI